MERQSSFGGSLVEYAIPTAILVGAVIAVSAPMVNELTGLTADTTNGSLSGSTVMVQSLGNRSSSVGTATGGTDLSGYLTATGYTGATQTLSFQTANGTTITIDNYPTDLAGSPDTLGANGTTEILAQIIQEVVAQMVAAGEITPAQGGTLIDLANSGHTMAGYQAAIGDAARNYTTTIDSTSTIFHNGQMVTLGDLQDSLGITTYSVTPGASTDILANGSQYVSGEMANFVSLYQQAVTDGSLNDPGIHALITSLSADIVDMGKHTDSSLMVLFTSNANPGDFDANMAARITNTNSDTICTVGNGNVGNFNCS